MTSLAAMARKMENFDSEKIEGHILGFEDLKRCVRGIEGQSEEQLQKRFPFLGKRASSIEMGGRLALVMGEFLGVRTWKISTRGLRYGTILDNQIERRFIV